MAAAVSSGSPACFLENRYQELEAVAAARPERLITVVRADGIERLVTTRSVSCLSTRREAQRTLEYIRRILLQKYGNRQLVDQAIVRGTDESPVLSTRELRSIIRHAAECRENIGRENQLLAMTTLAEMPAIFQTVARQDFGALPVDVRSRMADKIYTQVIKVCSNFDERLDVEKIRSVIVSWIQISLNEENSGLREMVRLELSGIFRDLTGLQLEALPANTKGAVGRGVLEVFAFYCDSFKGWVNPVDIGDITKKVLIKYLFGGATIRELLHDRRGFNIAVERTRGLLGVAALRAACRWVMVNWPDFRELVAVSDLHLCGFDRQALGMMLDSLAEVVAGGGAPPGASLQAGDLRRRAGRYARAVSALAPGSSLMPYAAAESGPVYRGRFFSAYGSTFEGVYKPDLCEPILTHPRARAQGFLDGTPRLSERAVMASRIDGLLGFNQIVKTEFAGIIEQAGFVRRGIVMEFAVGKSPREMGAAAYHALCEGNALFQRGVVGLQLEDFLSYQTDRTIENYIVAADGRVLGIDNECCCGSVDLLGTPAELEFPPRKSTLLHLPRVIDPEQRAAILRLSPAMLREEAEDLLAAEEITALVSRLAIMQDFYSNSANFTLIDGQNDRFWGNGYVWGLMSDWHNSYAARDARLLSLLAGS